ncbi:Protein OPI10-like protein, partial [Lachnellula suecica]
MAQQPSLPQLFGLIPTGHTPILTPTAAPAQTSFINRHRTPPNTAAAVYISLPNASAGGQPSFKFLGGIGPGKESAIFKISGLTSSPSASTNEIDMDAPEGTAGSGGGEVTIGISVEPADNVSAQMAALSAPKTESNALVLANKGSGKGKPDTLVLAQRIIKNAFNFLASFGGNV